MRKTIRRISRTNPRVLAELVGSGTRVLLLLALSIIFLLSAGAWCQQRPAVKDVSAGARLPKCTEPLAGVEVPNAPHGLFVILFPDAKVNEEAAKYLLHNSVVAAGRPFGTVHHRCERT